MSATPASETIGCPTCDRAGLNPKPGFFVKTGLNGYGVVVQSEVECKGCFGVGQVTVAQYWALTSYRRQIALADWVQTLHDSARRRRKDRRSCL